VTLPLGCTHTRESCRLPIHVFALKGSRTTTVLRMVRLSVSSGYCASPTAYAFYSASVFPVLRSDSVSNGLLGGRVEPLALLNGLHDHLPAFLCVYNNPESATRRRRARAPTVSTPTKFSCGSGSRQAPLESITWCTTLTPNKRGRRQGLT
jgi:hypothetical protein